MRKCTLGDFIALAIVAAVLIFMYFMMPEVTGASMPRIPM